MRNRILHLACLPQGQCQAVLRLGGAGLDSHRRAVLFDRLRNCVLSHQNPSQVAVRLEKIGLESQRLFVAFDGVDVPAHLFQSQSPIIFPSG